MTDDAMAHDAGEVQEPHASPPVPEDLDVETPDKSAFAAVRDKLRKKAITGLFVLIPIGFTFIVLRFLFRLTSA